MFSPLSINLSALLFLSSLLLVPTSSLHAESGQAANKHVAIFVFGDSVYDPGNNDYLNLSIDYKSNFPPYGETFFRYPTGRVCDGRIIPDFAAMYANLPLWVPYLQPGSHNFSNGASFASAGAGVLIETDPGTLNLRIQFGYLKKVAYLLTQQLGEAEAQKILADAIYLSSIGGVDYMSFITSNSNITTESEQQEYVKIVIGNLTDVIKEIYDLGGRKFAFQNVGPLGCAPEAKQYYNLSGGGCVEQLQAIARLHNNVLSNITKELQSQLSGFNYLIFDYYNALYDMISQPAKYGFNVSDFACCGTGSHRGSGCGRIEEYELCPDPNEYVFFDGDHETERANSILADMLWSGEPKFTWPLNMKQLYELESSIEILSEDDGFFTDEQIVFSQ